MSLNRKMRRQMERQTKSEVTVKVDGAEVKPFGMTKAGYNAIYQAGYEEARKELVPYCAKYYTYQILAVCCKILMEDYSKIHVRKTRLEKFTELYARGLEMLGEDKSTQQYIEYIEHFGLKTRWKEPDTDDGQL